RLFRLEAIRIKLFVYSKKRQDFIRCHSPYFGFAPPEKRNADIKKAGKVDYSLPAAAFFLISFSSSSSSSSSRAGGSSVPLLPNENALKIEDFTSLKFPV